MKLLFRLKHPHHFSRHRLSGKLVMLFIVMAIVFVLLFGYGFRQAIHSHFETIIVPHIVKYLEYVENDIGSPPDRQRAKALATELNINIMLIDQQGQWSSNQSKINLDHLKIKHSHYTGDKRYDLVTIDKRDYLMTKTAGNTLLFGIPEIKATDSDRHGIVLIGLLLLVLVILYHATRRIFSPITTIEAGIKRIGQGDLSHRIQIKRRDELGVLAESINAMADDIQHMLDAKRQMLLAISHELRSPLTRAKVAVELLDDGKQKQQLNTDLNEMERLIEEILETERLSTKHSVLNKTRQDLSQLVKEVVATYFSNSDITMELPPDSVLLDLDAPRICLLLKNLIDNAIRHTPRSANPPRVTLKQEARHTIIEVVDNGSGIDEKHLPHLTEPFYRADPSRQRETGGYGLGLYLCKMITEAHGGSLTIRSQPHAGTVVTIRLPTRVNNKPNAQ